MIKEVVAQMLIIVTSCHPRTVSRNLMEALLLSFAPCFSLNTHLGDTFCIHYLDSQIQGLQKKNLYHSVFHYNNKMPESGCFRKKRCLTHRPRDSKL